MVITKTNNNHIECSVDKKRTNKGLLPLYQSRADLNNRYKQSLIKTMLGRANRSSCSPDLFSKECHDLRKCF